MGGSAKAGGGQSTLKDYYSSEAAVVAVGNGRVYLESIYVDGERVWHTYSPIDLSSQPVPYSVDVYGRGRMYIYSGDAAQTLSDPVLTKGGRDFSPMRNRIVVVFKDWLAGRERTSVPDFRLVIRRQPEQAVVTGQAALLDSSGQVNEVAAAAELFTSEVHGAGIDASFIDQSSWQAIADEMLAESSTAYLSMVLRDKMTIDAVAQEIRGYNGVGFRPSREGKIEAFRIRQGIEAPEDLPIVRSEDIEAGSFPTITSVLQQDMDSRFELKWTNKDRNFEEEPVRWENKLARARSSRKNPGSYSRPWVQRGNQAQATVARLGQRDSTPYEKIDSLKISEVKADEIKQGDLFLLALEDNGQEFAKVCLMKTMTGWGDGESSVTCTAETARGVYPGAGWEDFVEEVFEEEEPLEDLLYCNILQSTQDLSGSKHHIFALAARQQGLVTGFEAYLKAQSDDFQLAGRSRSWAVAGTLASDYDSIQPEDDDSGNLKFVKAIAEDPFGFDQLDTVYTEDEYLDDRLLLVVISSSDPAEYEIFSVKAMLSPVSGEYPLQSLRARRGSEALNHFAGDRAYLVYRESIDFFTHSQVEALGKEQDPEDRVLTVRCVPYHFRDILGLEDTADRTLTIRDTYVEPPQSFQVVALAGGFKLVFGISEKEVVGVRVWSSSNPDVFPDDPEFIFPITSREIEQGTVNINVYDPDYREGSPVFFKAQTYDNERLTNFSEEVGPVGTSAFVVNQQGPRVSISAPDNNPWRGGLTSLTKWRLQAFVVNYAEEVEYQWYRSPLNDPSGPMSIMTGFTSNILEVPTRHVAPNDMQTEPQARRYLVTANGAQSDYITLYVPGTNAYHRDNPLFRLTNEIETIDMHEDLTYPRPYAVSSYVVGYRGSSGSAANMTGEDPDGVHTNLFKFWLVLPDGLDFVTTTGAGAWRGIRLTDTTFLASGTDDTTFNIEVWATSGGSPEPGSKIADLPFTVRKNVLVSAERILSMETDGPQHFEQPITPTSFHVTATTSLGAYEVFSTQAKFDVASDGTITRAAWPWTSPDGYGNATISKGLRHSGRPLACPDMSVSFDSAFQVTVGASRIGTVSELTISAEPNVLPPSTNEDFIGDTYLFSTSDAVDHDLSLFVGDVGFTS